MEKFSYYSKISRALLQIIVLSGLLLWLYGTILTNLVLNWWSDPNYSHGFLIPIISFYLVWKRISSSLC